jgi:hypothetical protein
MNLISGAALPLPPGEAFWLLSEDDELPLSSEPEDGELPVSASPEAVPSDTVSSESVSLPEESVPVSVSESAFASVFPFRSAVDSAESLPRASNELEDSKGAYLSPEGSSAALALITRPSER